MNTKLAKSVRFAAHLHQDRGYMDLRGVLWLINDENRLHPSEQVQAARLQHEVGRRKFAACKRIDDIFQALLLANPFA